MNTLKRVMRAMTHLNIGAAFGLSAWALELSLQPAIASPSAAAEPASLIATGTDRRASGLSAAPAGGRSHAGVAREGQQ